MFKERYFGLYDEDDMLDDLRIRVQRRGESISDFVDAFIYLVSRLKHPPPVHTQVAIAFKNVLPEYRSHMIGRLPRSFEELLELGREYEKGKKLDERYSQVTSKKWDKSAAMEEKSGDKEVNDKGGEKAANKGKKKKGGKQVNSVPEHVEQVAEIQVKQTDPRWPMGQTWSMGQTRPNAGQSQQQAPWGQPRPNQQPRRVSFAPPPQPQYSAVNSQVLPAASQPTAGPQHAQKNLQQEPQDFSWTSQQQPQRSTVCRECGQSGHRIANCPQTKCYACNEFGHIAPACPKFPPSELYCYKCNLPGYTARNCPKCNPPVQAPENGSAGNQ